MPHYQQLDTRWLPAVQLSYADPALSRRRQRASLSFGVPCEQGNFSQKTFFLPADFLLNVIDQTVSHVHLKNRHLEREWNYFDWFRPKSLTNHRSHHLVPSPWALGFQHLDLGGDTNLQTIASSKPYVRGMDTQTKLDSCYQGEKGSGVGKWPRLSATSYDGLSQLC